MARNRKHQSAAVRFAPAIKVLLLCSFLVAAGVGYVWQKNQLVDLGRHRAVLEGRLRLLREQSQQVEHKVMGLQSPAFLESKVKEFKLGLGRVEPDKVIKLLEPSPVLQTPTLVEVAVPVGQIDRSPNRVGLAER
jgi:hypothetical protein